VLEWLEHYHEQNEEEKEDNPIFCMNGIEFFYFNEASRIDSTFEANGKSFDFEDILKLGFDKYIREQGFKNDEVYQTDVNYDNEIIYRSDILNDFIEYVKKNIQKNN